MSVPSRKSCPSDDPAADDLHAFMMVVRQALLMIVAYINKRYRLK